MTYSTQNPFHYSVNVFGRLNAIGLAAEYFFARAAQCSPDNNLRLTLLQLSRLHRSLALNKTTATTQHQSGTETLSQQLAAVQFWYQHHTLTLKRDTALAQVLDQLSSLLQQQLQAMKGLIRQTADQQVRIELASLSASLQIANDQLLKVLPAGRKKIQTLN